MKERKLYLLVTYVSLDVQAYDFFSKRSRLHDRNVDGINAISVNTNTIANMSNFQPQYKRRTKRRIKTLDSEIVTSYTFCFLK